MARSMIAKLPRMRGHAVPERARKRRHRGLIDPQRTQPAAGKSQIDKRSRLTCRPSRPYLVHDPRHQGPALVRTAKREERVPPTRLSRTLRREVQHQALNIIEVKYGTSLLSQNQAKPSS